MYHIFGLGIKSSIPFLDMPKREGKADVIVRYGKVPDAIPDAKIIGVCYQDGPAQINKLHSTPIAQIVI